MFFALVLKKKPKNIKSEKNSGNVQTLNVKSLDMVIRGCFGRDIESTAMQTTEHELTWVADVLC